MKHYSTVVDDFIYYSELIRHQINNNTYKTFYFDLFFKHGSSDYDVLKRIDVKHGQIVEISDYYPTPDEHEIIVRERQFMAELYPELLNELDDYSKSLLQKESVLAF